MQAAADGKSCVECKQAMQTLLRPNQVILQLTFHLQNQHHRTTRTYTGSIAVQTLEK